MPFKLDEVDASGRLVSRYESAKRDGRASVQVQKRASTAQSLRQQVFEAFLPNGYPASVTGDYTRYQIFDSLQAFSSSIAGLLASRAVLQGVGVGDATASPTAALILTIIQESAGRVATVVFAQRLGAALEPECKRWRLAADVFNDASMVLDCVSPLLARGGPRVALLCASSALRAMCGVAAGSAKASLSAHFARWDNLGELNAKDASQETVISLLGMLAGGLVVDRVRSPTATWACLLVLLAIHLLTNYAAVCAVRLNTLNRQRAGLVFSDLLDGRPAPRPAAVADVERIFETDGALRWRQSPVLARARIGVPFARLAAMVASDAVPEEPADEKAGLPPSLDELLDVFADERHVLWYSPSAREAAIVLKHGASASDQLKAWAHSLLLVRTIRLKGYTSLKGPPMDGPDSLLRLVQGSLQKLNGDWDGYMKELTRTGWDVGSACLETSAGVRVLSKD